MLKIPIMLQHKTDNSEDDMFMSTIDKYVA